MDSAHRSSVLLDKFRDCEKQPAALKGGSWNKVLLSLQRRRIDRGTMETIFGGEVSAGESTDDGEEDLVLREVGHMELRVCKWVHLTRKILLQCFMAGRNQWPVLITVEFSASSARYCYKFKTALRILDIDPTTHPDAILHRSDFKIFFKLLLGEFKIFA